MESCRNQVKGPEVNRIGRWGVAFVFCPSDTFAHGDGCMLLFSFSFFISFLLLSSSSIIFSFSLSFFLHLREGQIYYVYCPLHDEWWYMDGDVFVYMYVWSLIFKIGIHIHKFKCSLHHSFLWLFFFFFFSLAFCQTPSTHTIFFPTPLDPLCVGWCGLCLLLFLFLFFSFSLVQARIINNSE